MSFGKLLEKFWGLKYLMLICEGLVFYLGGVLIFLVIWNNFLVKNIFLEIF